MDRSEDDGGVVATTISVVARAPTSVSEESSKAGSPWDRPAWAVYGESRMHGFERRGRL